MRVWDCARERWNIGNFRFSSDEQASPEIEQYPHEDRHKAGPAGEAKVEWLARIELVRA
jgi:hypothetical protein